MKMPNTNYVPPAHIEVRVGCAGVPVRCSGVHVGCAEVFRYQHVGICSI